MKKIITILEEDYGKILDQSGKIDFMKVFKPEYLEDTEFVNKLDTLFTDIKMSTEVLKNNWVIEPNYKNKKYDSSIKMVLGSKKYDKLTITSKLFTKRDSLLDPSLMTFDNNPPYNYWVNDELYLYSIHPDVTGGPVIVLSRDAIYYLPKDKEVAVKLASDYLEILAN